MADETLEPGQILDVRQAAQMLGYHEESLRRMTREGRVPAFRIGRKWHYDRKVLARWTTEQHRLQEQQRETVRLSSVLVVDDEPDICTLYGRMLSAGGFRVRTAPGGREGIARLNEELPDVLIVDLMMPEVDGVDVLAHVRALAPELPVVVSTGYPDSALMARAMQHGSFTLLPKPVTREQLLSAVRLLTGRLPVSTES